MSKTREQKEEILEELRDVLNQKAIYLVDFEGLDSDSLFELRNKLKEQGYNLKVAKKTLLRKALKEKDKEEVAKKVKEIKKQMALISGEGEKIKKAKICYNFAQEHENLEILGGIEEKFMDQEEVVTLAKLPSKQELLSRLVGSLSSPISRLVNSLEGNIKGLMYILSNAKT